MEIPLKADENGVALSVLQCRNHILKPLHERFGIDVSDAAIRKAVDEHNRVCRLIRAIGEFRKEDKPRITGYEFHVLTLATYACQCPRMMNMEKVYGRKEYVKKIAEEYRADGVIYEQVKFCDPWAYERTLGSAMLREDYGWPVLSVDRPYNAASSSGQLRTRVQAFIESIEIKKIKGGGAA